MIGKGIKVLGEIHGLRIKNLNMMVMTPMNTDKSMGISIREGACLKWH